MFVSAIVAIGIFFLWKIGRVYLGLGQLLTSSLRLLKPDDDSEESDV